MSSYQLNTKTNDLDLILKTTSGADPGFFLGGGDPLKNDVTDGEVKKT